MPTPHAGTYGPEPFIDRRGNAVPSATVTVHESNGTTLATLYADRDRGVALANPLPTGVAIGNAGLDVRGNGLFFAEPGRYVMSVAVNGSTVWTGLARVEVDAADIDASAAADLAAHEADTTNVHGIADTSELVTQIEAGTTIGIGSVVDDAPVVTFLSDWGETALGVPYYDSDGAADGEQAILVPSQFVSLGGVPMFSDVPILSLIRFPEAP